MMSKFFLLAFLCISLTKVQGDELENAVKKGMIRVEALYNRGVARIDGVKDQSQAIKFKSAAFMEKVLRMQESSAQALRYAAQNAEEKAKEMKAPESVFNCISGAEKNTNDQIQMFTTKFQEDMSKREKMYTSKVQLACKPLDLYRKGLESTHDKTVAQINACETPKCVEAAVNKFSAYFERFVASVGGVQTQISSMLSMFQREARTALNNASRDIGRVQYAGLRKIRECLYNRGSL